MSELGKIDDFVANKAEEMFKKWCDLYDKYDELISKDLLQKELDKMKNAGDDEEKRSESEQKYLSKLKSRRVAIEEQESILDKIMTLQQQLKEKTDIKTDGSTTTKPVHPTARRARG
jgi:hypothetical protein